jgi:arginyl-tRNA synthetase
LGYDVLGINYLGDWGTNFGQLITAYKHWGDKETVEKDDIVELSRLYAKFHAEKDEALESEARAWLLKMQNGDEETLRLWAWFCEISKREYDRLYAILGVEFDLFQGESYYNDKMTAVVDELQNKGLLKLDQGARIVELGDYNMPPCLILRSDGGTLYPTRDIAAAIHRKNEYKFDKCYYITGHEQSLHFAQWMKVVELMGCDWADGLEHLALGLYTSDIGKLASRSGNNSAFMEDLLNEAVSRAKERMPEDLPDRDNAARMVGVGAVKFNDLYNTRIKDVTFDWDRLLNLEGDTGPYVQYTYARCCSILEKAKDITLGETDYSHISDEEVIGILYNFGEKIIDAHEKNEPYIISRYLISLAQAFNRFYHEKPILKADAGVRDARIRVVYAVKHVISKGLWLLGIESPNRM